LAPLTSIEASMNRLLGSALLVTCSVSLAAPARAQRSAPRATIVYDVGKEPAMPIPLLTNAEEANEDLADQLFLHLVTYAPGAQLSGDNALRPSLAKSWHRIDPLTLVFDIDPRAKWHDGAPVTVTYTWELVNSPKLKIADRARLDPIASVEAIGDRSVRVRFKQASLEQVYTFGFLIQPLPSHLLERMAPEAIATSEYAKHPIGNGPFKFERRVPGQLVELRADSTFFLGRPTIARVIFQTASNADARLNAFLAGEVDIYDHIPPTAMAQAQQHADTRLIEGPSNAIVYLLFNPRSPTDSTKPHPAFADLRVREALTLALDRETIAHVTFGANAQVPDAAQSQLWGWITPGGIKGRAADVVRARALLSEAGWRDANGDGILDKNGAPLSFSVLYVTGNPLSDKIALQAQEMFRKVGVALRLDKVEGAVINQRVMTGQWDMVYARRGQDPTPTSLVQSWSCESAKMPGPSNPAHWCDATFDKLFATAITAKDQPAAWKAVLDRMASQHPAIFIAAPPNPVAVHRRFDNVITWANRPWLSLWQWRVRPEAAIARDR